MECVTHKDKRATGCCHICHQEFCESCLKSFRLATLCTQHHNLALKANWKSLVTVELTSERPEKGLKLQEFKEKIWVEIGLPSYIITHYRINIEEDNIESCMDLYVRQQDVVILKKMLNDQVF